MADWKVPLADVVVSEDEIEAVAKTYRSGWLSMGPETHRFEEALREYTGARHALAVANGTSALHLMCVAAGLGPGDEVVVPSLTFVATVNAVAYTGARPVFADIAGPLAPWLSRESVEAVLSARTRAIMTMSYGGHPGEVDSLRALADERGILLLEDAAHALGGRLGGRHLGTFGASGAFSLFSNKNLAVGEGGAVVTDDHALASEMRTLRSHGMTSLSWDRHRGHAQGYDVVALGYNYRLDEPRSTLARVRLASLDEQNQRRGELVDHYRHGLNAIDGVTPALPLRPDSHPAYHLFTVLLADDIDRDGFRRRLAEAGIQTSLHYPAVHRFSIYDGSSGPLPVTDGYSARAVTLPLFAHMTDHQQDAVIEAVAEAAG